MKRILWLLPLLVLAGHANARPLGELAQVTVIDRDSGAHVPTHLHRGEYWVAGRPGARYAIQIRNRLGERILAVVSVDGVNVISGETASWDQTGYVLDAQESYQITGWRKSDAEVAAFTFTESPHSYAERTGRPANVGVIGVALFREQPRVPRIAAPAAAPPPSPLEPEQSPGQTRGPTAGRLLPPEAARRAAPQEDTSQAPAAVPTQPKLGTGHGERETSYIDHTQFVRLQAQPNEIVRIHYDSTDNLIAMGIIQPPRQPLPAPDPFPASRSQYVPDPPEELP